MIYRNSLNETLYKNEDFSVQKDEAFLSYFKLKNPFFTFSERDFSAPKLLNN